jgi:hypothetical protein
MLRGSHQCTSLRIGKSELFHRQRQETSYCKGSTMLEIYQGLSCPYEPEDTAFMIQVVIAPFQVLILFSALNTTTTLIGFLFVGISTIYTICVSCFLLTTSGARVAYGYPSDTSTSGMRASDLQHSGSMDCFGLEPEGIHILRYVKRSAMSGLLTSDEVQWVPVNIIITNVTCRRRRRHRRVYQSTSDHYGSTAGSTGPGFG